MAHAPSAPWDRLRAWMGVLSDLQDTAAVLEWDRETIMPSGGSAARAAQLATLATLEHRELLRPEVADDLAAVLDGDDDPARRASARLAHRLRDRAARLPEDLVRAITETSSTSMSTWVEARPANDLPAYLGALGPLVELKREVARALTDDGGEPYDALMDEYEPGARATEIDAVLADLIGAVRPLVDELADAGGPSLPARTWPAEAQIALARDLAGEVGFSLRDGLVGTTAHPVTMGLGVGDVRFSTRVDEGDPIDSIMAVMHEAGHGLYEQGLPPPLARTLAHGAPSLGAHESQSRFWENHLGRSRAFWGWAAPRLRERFPAAMEGLGADDIRGAVNRVRRTLIRVGADEVTYDLHVALRFRLERALVNGRLEVADLPEAWDDGMEELLGLRPPSPAEGVMQDVHWPAGIIGYFPTYSLGNLYAAQLAEALESEVGPVEEVLAADGFAPFLAFMRERVHRHGSVLMTRELMEQATGRPLEVAPFLAHLERIYAGR